MNIVITESTKGIGLKLAEEFIKKGHGVLIHSKDRISSGLIYAQLHSKYPNAPLHIYACEVNNYNSLERMYFEAKRYFGSVDIWINNPGIPQKDSLIQSCTGQDISNIIDKNIKGTVNGSKIAAQHMKDSGGGIYNIVNCNSNKESIYKMTNNSIAYFTKLLSKELKRSKIKVCLLNPGIVETELQTDSLPTNKLEIVVPFLVNKILKNKKNGAIIKWLTTPKMILGFILTPFRKRN